MVTVKPETIPDRFKQRGRWLMWDNSSDTPRRPHWKGDFSVSYSDPDDWHAFEDAYAAAQERESWGIGYVFQPSDDEYAIDIDRPYNDDGEPRDWFPGLDRFTDAGAYMEWSPSGNGVHIPIEGRPPEWWRDSDLGPDTHQGVDVLKNSFCTFTGDTLPESGDSVTDANAAPFLYHAYQNIRGETPRMDSKGGQGNGDIELAESDVEEALSHVDENLSYSDWLRVGFAVYDWDSGSNGKRLFEQWSKSNPKWDASRGQRHIDDIWSGSPNGSVTVGTLVHFAKEGGWEPPKGKEGSDNVTQPLEEHSENTSTKSNDGGSTWEYVRTLYAEDRDQGRLGAADALEETTDWMYVVESERLWVYDDSTGYFKPRGQNYAQRILESELGAYYRSQEANEIIERLQARNQTRRKELNARNREDPLLCVGNGVVNLRTGGLLDHSPEYKFTRGLQWDYAPGCANPEPVLEFLGDVTKREEDRDTLLDHLAHGLMPGHPYRAFIIMYGPGSNGKTKTGELFRRFVGEENAASVELQDLTRKTDQFATGALPGAYINVGDDVSIGELRDTSILKSLTGGGTMRANEKFEKKFDFKNQAAMFFSANEPPRFAEKSEAIADRLYPIELPYRFVNDPQGELEKAKETGIVDRLANDDRVMRGLLLLAVKHAQELIERDGEYSMNETPQERRERYESASDPVKRFALEYLQESGGSSYILKDDAYKAYKKMCDRQSERVKSDDIFKRAISQMATLDAESAQTRSLSPGDSAETAWKYVEFNSKARDLLPDRLERRYFEGEESTVTDDSEETGEVVDSLNARPVRDVAQEATGYPNVTAEVLKVENPDGENTPAMRATVKDESSAIDVISWDTPDRLTEGATVLIENAKVTEFDGDNQLVMKDAVTTVTPIQRGVGHTESQATADGQSSLQTATDGGTATQQVREHIKTECNSGESLSVAQVAGDTGLDPESVQSALETIKEEDSLLEAGGDGFKVL